MNTPSHELHDEDESTSEDTFEWLAEARRAAGGEDAELPSSDNPWTRARRLSRFTTRQMSRELGKKERGRRAYKRDGRKTHWQSKRKAEQRARLRARERALDLRTHDPYKFYRELYGERWAITRDEWNEWIAPFWEQARQRERGALPRIRRKPSGSYTLDSFTLVTASGRPVWGGSDVRGVLGGYFLVPAPSEE